MKRVGRWPGGLRFSHRSTPRQQGGYTIVELVVALVVLTGLVFSSLQLFVALVNSALVMKHKGVALSLATSQMEYLKSLPYDALAVSGGSIIASSYIPPITYQTISGTRYTITTSINYVDEAYDGCASYPTPAIKQKYCRNYPPPTGAPAVDTNPADYKVLHVKVAERSGTILSDVDTQVAARVAETASNTGALFVTVNDGNGNPLSSATVTVTDSTVTPAVNATDVTDQNGLAIFYGLPPDTTNYDYVIQASKTNYSSLSTIPPTATLQPTYKSIQIIAQQATAVTLPIFPMTSASMLLEVVDTDGAAIANAKVYAKGGYKKYTAVTDTAYYFDTMSPTDTRVASNAVGMIELQNLVPGQYYLCGDLGATSCAVGSTTYYLAAAVPYTGPEALSPSVVPVYDSDSPPTTVFSYNSKNFVQKVRVILATAANWPRLGSLTPDEASISTSSLSAFPFTLTGGNLPCSASSCATSISLQQGSTNFPATCTGSQATGGLWTLHCTVDLTGAVEGPTNMIVVANGHTLTLPTGMAGAGINVTP